MNSFGKTIYETLGRGPIHPFPARMAPGIALAAMEELGASITVLDPMMGSGTVLAMAQAQGHRAIGVDIDPLAVLISRVWTTKVDKPSVAQKAADVLARARQLFKRTPASHAYPRGADEETRGFTRYWFDDHARRQLTCLAKCISRIRERTTRDVLWCAFSRLIITKQAGASLAMDLSHSRPHRRFTTAPEKPFRRYLAAVDRVLSNCIDGSSSFSMPSATALSGDARQLPLADSSIDLVLTSPPYLNAIDYFRCSKFSLIWMGHSIGSLRSLRAASVGTERGLNSNETSIDDVVRDMGLPSTFCGRNAAILRRYVSDMQRSTSEVARVLRIGGRAVYVVGENTIRGTFVQNATVVAAVARLSGLRLLSRQSRELPANRRYLPMPEKPAQSLGGRMRQEVLLTFERC